MKKIFLCAFGLACMAVACNSVVDEPVQYGEISVALGEPDVEVISKAAETLDQSSAEAAEYMVRIFKKGDDIQTATPQYSVAYNAFTSPKQLPLDTYFVTAENCTAAEAEAENKMRLFGQSEEITLSVDAISQTATVNCEVANARVAVVFDESVRGQFTGLKVELKGSKNVTVDYAGENIGEETVVWYNPQTIAYKISGTFTQLDKIIELPETERVLAAKNNIKIVVRLNTSNGQLLPEITVNKDIDTPTEVPGEFNPYE